MGALLARLCRNDLRQRGGRVRMWGKPSPTTWCESCGIEWSVRGMGWTDAGLYRCRRCNPDPGPPHEMQTPVQHARSKRYAAAKDGRARRQRCTECGCKIRKYGFSPSNWPGGESENVHYNVELCSDCVGPDPYKHGWLGFELVGI